MNAQVNNIETKIGEQIFWNAGAGFGFGEIVEVREKAVKMNYGIEPATSSVLVFSWSAWVPKSAIKASELPSCYDMKPWFKAKIQGYKIHRYFYNNEGKKVNV